MKNDYLMKRPGLKYCRIYRWNPIKFALNMLILLSFITILIIVFSTSSNAGQTPKSVIVKSGDTLWMIAETTRPAQDPRLTIETIRKANQLKSVIVHPGQEILVP